MKILSLAGSSSSKSINLQLVRFVTTYFKNDDVAILNLNDFEMPIYSSDFEEKNGIPQKANKFLDHLKQTDKIVISLAEHNGSYSAAFKNILDWTSRLEGKLFCNKPMLLMATSPGARGGSSVLEAAKNRFPFLGADIKSTFSLPEFNKNFKTGEGIVNPELKKQLEEAIKNFY